jgi:hypothetical protein
MQHNVTGVGPEPTEFPYNITPREAAVMLGTTDEALNHRRSRGTGPAYAKVNGRVTYAYHTLRDFADKHGIALKPVTDALTFVEMPVRDDAPALN